MELSDANLAAVHDVPGIRKLYKLPLPAANSGSKTKGSGNVKGNGKVKVKGREGDREADIKGPVEKSETGEDEGEDEMEIKAMSELETSILGLMALRGAA